MKIHKILPIIFLITTLFIIPVSANDSSIVGNWEIKVTTPIAFFNVDCGSGIAVIYADGTGTMSGKANFLMFEKTISNKKFKWQKMDDEKYIIFYENRFGTVYYNSATNGLSASANAKDFGLDINKQFLLKGTKI